MDSTAASLVVFGGILLLGLGMDFLGRHTFLPRVTLLLVCGIALGDSMLGLIPAAINGRFDLVTQLALMMIGFLLGGKLTRSAMVTAGRQLAWISLSASLGTTLVVITVLIVFAVPLPIAILLGCIAAATAPAATVDIVMESGRTNRFSELLLAIVAVDDAWALLLFSIGLSAVAMLNGTLDSAALVQRPVYEIFGAVVLGGVIGLPAAKLTGRIRQGQPMLVEALGLVLLSGGLALLAEVSLIITVMTVGAVIANLAKHHEYAFHEIENIEWPFMIVFFVLAGATLEIRLVAEVGLIGLVYILARAIGKMLGAWLGGRISKAQPEVQRWMGMALMPQAGVAIGMSLLAASEFPEYGPSILTIVIGTTIVFEIAGPVLTRLALARAAEADSGDGTLR